VRRILAFYAVLRASARDLAAVGVPLALLIELTRSTEVQRAIPLAHFTVIMALLAVAGGGMTAILAHVVGRLAADSRAVWLSIALALYTLAAVPAATIHATFAQAETAVSAARLFAQAAVVVLLGLAAWAPTLPHYWRGWWLSALGLMLTLVVAGLSSGFPGTALAIVNAAPVALALAIAGPLAGLAVAVVGWIRGNISVSVIGLGCAILMLAPIGGTGAADGPVAEFGLTFPSTQLFGMLLVLAGLVQLVRRTLRRIDSTRAEKQKELLLARRNLVRAAERDHELRTGLAGLAGAAHLFELPALGDDAPVLSSAVSAELSRLDTLLGVLDANPRGVSHAYPVLPVLRQLVALRRCAGMDIRVDAELGLCALGSPSTLAQVLTNVLTNCAKHAPGSPVRIQVSKAGGVVRIRISDFGPGVRAGAEELVFGVGVRGERSQGDGLGLHISRQLLAPDGGRIFMRPTPAQEPGCTVVVELRAAVADRSMLHRAALVDLA
jgi:two-component system OmpR family sensor kinase